eukprot:SAG25_NODE_1322_length_3291_cov_7.635652_2_plen_118_part_00
MYRPKIGSEIVVIISMHASTSNEWTNAGESLLSLAQETKRVPSTGTAVQRYSSRSAGYLPLLPPLTMADRWMRDYNDAMYAPPHPPRHSCPSVPAVSFVTPSRVALRHWGHGLSCDS